MSIILGKPFLTTVCTLIDIENGRLIFWINGEELEFNLADKDRDKESIDLVSKLPRDEKVNQEVHEELKSISFLGKIFMV